jgi:hypothetical protein
MVRKIDPRVHQVRLVALNPRLDNGSGIALIDSLALALFCSSRRAAERITSSAKRLS